MSIEEQIYSLVDSCLQMDNQNEFIAILNKIEELLNILPFEVIYSTKTRVRAKLKDSKIITDLVNKIVEKVKSMSYEITGEEIEKEFNLDNLIGNYASNDLIKGGIIEKLEKKLINEAPAKGLYSRLLPGKVLSEAIDNNAIDIKQLYPEMLEIFTLYINNKINIGTTDGYNHDFFPGDYLNVEDERVKADLRFIMLNKIDRNNFLGSVIDGTLTDDELEQFVGISQQEVINRFAEFNYSESDLFNCALSLGNLFSYENSGFDYFGDKMLQFLQNRYPKFYDFIKRETIDFSDIEMVTEISDQDAFIANLSNNGTFDVVLSGLQKIGKSLDEITEYFFEMLNDREKEFNTSPDFMNWCIKNKCYNLIHRFSALAFTSKNAEDLTKPEIFLELLKYELPFWFRKSPEFLKASLENKRYDLLYYFWGEAFTPENMTMLLTTEVFSEMSKYKFPIGLSNSYEFLRICLENKKYDWISRFGSDAFTSKYISEIIKPEIFNEISKYEFPKALTFSVDFLNGCLENKKYEWVSFFDSSAFYKDTFEKAEVFNEISKNGFINTLANSSHFLTACLKNKKYEWVFNFKKEAFTPENFAEIIKPEVFNEISKYEFPKALTFSADFLNGCLENKKYEWVSFFEKEAFTPDNFAKIIKPEIFSEISKYNFPYALASSREFLKACINNQQNNWIFSFNAKAYTPETLQILIDNLGIITFLKIHLGYSCVFLENVANLKLNELDFAIITKFGKLVSSNVPSSVIENVGRLIIELYDSIKVSQVEEIIQLVMQVSFSNSEEIQRLSSELIPILIDKENPLEELEKIEKIFLKKGLPYVAKNFIVFQNLHSEDDLRYDMSSFVNTISPVLKNCNDSKIWSNHYAIIWSDLLKCALGSNNRSLKEFINQIDQGNQLYMLYSFGKIKFEDFTLEQKQILNGFVSQLNTLYNMSQKGKEKSNELSGNILEDLDNLVELIEPSERRNLADKIIRMYGIFEGINSLASAKEYLDLLARKSDLRHRILAESEFKLEPGDFIKGISSIRFLAPTLQNGAVAQEFLGYAAGRDTTPLDTDLARITKDMGNFCVNLDSSIASGYSANDGFWIVLKNDDRFQLTRLYDDDIEVARANNPLPAGETENIKFKREKIEAFYTSGATENSIHYGIRTGFASSEIDFIISKPCENLNYDPRICVEVAMNGFYIPVVDMDGHLVFTPRDYDELRAKMQGLSYYDADKYEFSSTLANQQINAIVANLNDLTSDTLDKNTKVNKYFEQIFNEMGYKFKSGFDGDITPGSVELINTGSTSRLTNANKDGDYDFILRIDKSIISEPAKLLNFKNELLSKIEFTRNDGGNHPRLKGVKIPGLANPVDIDLTFVNRTNQLNYSTERSLEDRLKTISKQDSEKYQYVLANIILAKQTLKAAKCYKPKHSGDAIPDEEKCGLGGVGIENWVLQNGGSFQQAAESFLAVAEGKNFEEFCRSYYVWDFGENHKAVKEGTYVHDNFVDNMTPGGYEKMKKALRQYLSEVKNVEQQVSVGIFDTIESPGRKM